MDLCVGATGFDGFTLCCNWISQHALALVFRFLGNDRDLPRVTDNSKAQLLIPQVALYSFSNDLQPRVRPLNQIFLVAPVVLHWIVVTNGILGKLYSVFANDYGGGAVNVQDSSTENKPAWGKRERRREKGRGGREEEEGKEPFNGDRRKRVSVSMELKLRSFYEDCLLWSRWTLPL